MSAYNRLMTIINNGQVAAPQREEGKSLINKTLEALDNATSVAYAHTVDTIGSVAGAAQANIVATPTLARAGFARGQERAARVLMRFMAK